MVNMTDEVEVEPDNFSMIAMQDISEGEKVVFIPMNSILTKEVADES